MIHLTEKTTIHASAAKVFKFLVNIDNLYKSWHPKDHIFCQTIFGKIEKPGAIIHFLEFIGRFPLYMMVRVTKIIPNEIIEYEPVPPFSFLKIGKGGFKLHSVAENKTLMTAYLIGGYNNILGKIMDSLVYFFIPETVARKHMKEEGNGIKKFIKENKNFKIEESK